MNPAMINTKLTEFFSHMNDVYVIHEGTTFKFINAPLAAIEILAEALENDQLAKDGLTLMGITKSIDRLKAYAQCRFGALDEFADFGQKGSSDELINCDKKRTCKGCGLVCKKKFSVAGETLSSREIQIAYLLAEGNDTEKIARLLFIEPITVRSTLLNIKAKLGILNNYSLVSYFIKNNIA